VRALLLASPARDQASAQEYLNAASRVVSKNITKSASAVSSDESTSAEKQRRREAVQGLLALNNLEAAARYTRKLEEFLSSEVFNSFEQGSGLEQIQVRTRH
jgi:hypothetical protein